VPSWAKVSDWQIRKAREAGVPVAKEVQLPSGEVIRMVYIPPGTFEMGSPETEEGRYDDETQHRVTLTNGFYLGIHEVTQGQWQAVMGENPSHLKGTARLPVEEVSWNDVQGFLGKAGGGLRLPTEAEWEYACRAGTRTPFWTGETVGTEQANYDGDFVYGNGRKGEYRGKTTVVESFGPNPWGLYDTHGNVWEWCADWCGDYPSGPVTDPTGPRRGECRVLRGGSWGLIPGSCRSADRCMASPGNRSSLIGFRVAMDSG
jgi:formylglycine-generating enzyme required for sulfatase activity